MKKVILQVYYCGCNESLNDFLATLNLEGSNYPKLHNITYIPKPEGSGNNDSIQFNGSIIAAVQYLKEVDVPND